MGGWVGSPGRSREFTLVEVRALEAAFEAQRHFVANASHELRTPLTAERTLLQVALDDPGTTTAAWRSTAHEVLASSDEQARLIDALLTLASSESGLNGHEPVDLVTTVFAVLAGLEPDLIPEATSRSSWPHHDSPLQDRCHRMELRHQGCPTLTGRVWPGSGGGDIPAGHRLCEC